MTEATPRPDTSDMAAVHKVFRSSLATAPDFVGGAAGDDTRRALMANYYENLMAFLTAHHDAEEALVYPVLIERAPDQQAVLEKGVSQHADVVALKDAVLKRVGSWTSADDAQTSDVVDSLQALDRVLSPHLDYEEAEVVPLATEYLAVEEWGALAGHTMGHFTGDKIWLIMGLVRENFTQLQRDRMLENLPPPARQMWENMGEASFKDLIAQVRQTA